jgi:hypothetical protein
MKFRQEYLSFDCAYKSLGVCHIIIEFDKLALIEQLKKCEDAAPHSILQLAQMIDNIIRVIDIGTYDILPGNAKETDMETKTILLKQFLTRYDNISPDAIVLIENQPIKIGGFGHMHKINTESPIVAHQLCFHFSPRSRMIEPTMKGKVSFGENLTLGYFMAQFAGKFKTESECKRKARKEHAKANLRWFLDNFAPTIKLATTTMDDAADAFMQIMAYIKL